MTTHRLILRPDGTMRWLEPPPFKVTGRVKRERFSHIRPCNPVLLAAFLLLRWAFGEKGKVYDFTKRWPCRWKMTVIETRFTAESDNREELITLEREKFFEPLGDL